jgi:hypothetical protein
MLFLGFLLSFHLKVFVYGACGARATRSFDISETRCMWHRIVAPMARERYMKVMIVQSGPHSIRMIRWSMPQGTGKHDRTPTVLSAAPGAS